VWEEWLPPTGKGDSVRASRLGFKRYLSTYLLSVQDYEAAEQDRDDCTGDHYGRDDCGHVESVEYACGYRLIGAVSDACQGWCGIIHLSQYDWVDEQDYTDNHDTYHGHDYLDEALVSVRLWYM